MTWLLPPKIRTKGRFQGITKVAEWAKKMTREMGGQGRAPEKGELSLLRKAFSGLAQLNNFLSRFCRACETSEKFLKIMKQKGLNQETYKQAKELLVELPEKSIVHQRLRAWLEKHLSIQCNPQAELNRLVYIIPLLCGVHSKIDIARSLQSCPH